MPKSTELRPGRPDEVGMDPGRLEMARQLAEDAVGEGRTPALIVLVARRGTIVLHEAFGEQRPGGPALQKDTIFPIASATKPLTAACVLALAEDGRLGTGRPVREYIPELGGDAIDEVLVHHLLTHTSGFDDMVQSDWIMKKVSSDGMPTLPPHFHPLHHVPLLLGLDTPRSLRPGEAMVYCNFNYTLLGEIVERVSGKPFQDYARERIFEPLGMKDTDYVLRDDMQERRLHRPLEAPLSTELQGLPGTETEAWQRMPNGAGGAYSTAMDLARFGQMLLNGGRYGDQRILGRATVAEMTQNQIPGTPARFLDFEMPEAGYGYGLIYKTHVCWGYMCGISSRGSYSHTGAGGISLWVDPVEELVQAYLEVTLELSENLEPVSWSFDRFQNVVASALDD